MPRENLLQARIVKDLRGRGAFVYVHAPSAYSGGRGIPDIYSSLSPVGSFWFETKKSVKDEAKRHQKGIINRIRRGGTPAYVIQTWDQYLSAMKEILDGRPDLSKVE